MTTISISAATAPGCVSQADGSLTSRHCQPLSVTAGPECTGNAPEPVQAVLP